MEDEEELQQYQAMKWQIIYAKEREEELVADTINEACQMANRNRKKGEKIVAVKLKR